MRELIFAFNLVSAAAAICAAVFWFLSAAGRLPPIITYWGGAPPTDPLHAALQQGVRMSRIAAAFAGVSALAMATATLLQARIGSS